MDENNTALYGDDQHSSKYPIKGKKTKILKDTFEQSIVSENEKFPPESNVFLVHKRNTKKELKIGRSLYVFNGNEKISVPKEVINHTDFKGQEKYFVIKEAEYAYKSS